MVPGQQCQSKMWPVWNLFLCWGRTGCEREAPDMIHESLKVLCNFTKAWSSARCKEHHFYAFSEQTLGILSQRCAMTLISSYFPMSTLSQSSATIISVLQSSSSNSSARISWPSSLSLSTLSIRKSWFELISWRHLFWRIHLRIWWGKGSYLHTVKC